MIIMWSLRLVGQKKKTLLKEEDEDLLFWRALAAAHLDHLEGGLSYVAERDMCLGYLDPQVVENAFQVIGSQLKSLRISCEITAVNENDDEPGLLRMLATHCTQLETLVYWPQYDEPLADHMHLVERLRHLTTLTVRCYHLTASGVQQMLRAAAQLKGLIMDKINLSALEFVALLQEFPQLEQLSIAHCSFGKKNQHHLKIM